MMDWFLVSAPVVGLLFGAYITRVQQSGRDVSTDLLLAAGVGVTVFAWAVLR